MYKVVDTEERSYKGFGERRVRYSFPGKGKGRRQPFRFVAGKYSIFLAIGKGSSFSFGDYGEAVKYDASGGRRKSVECVEMMD